MIPSLVESSTVATVAVRTLGDHPKNDLVRAEVELVDVKKTPEIFALNDSRIERIFADSPSTKLTRLAIFYQKALLRLAVKKRAGDIPAYEFMQDALYMIKKIQEFYLPTASNPDRKFLDESKDNYRYVLRLQQDIVSRGYPLYGELNSLMKSAANLGSINPFSFHDYGYCDLARKILDPSAEKSRNFDYTERNFLPILPFINFDGQHLGFRVLNDYSAMGISLVEIPDAIPGEDLIVVDEQDYNFGRFIEHDDSHAIASLKSSARIVSGAEGLAKISQKLEIKWVERYLAYLEFRQARYREVRSYIDRISEKRMRILAEGLWFVLDHEFNYAYEKSQRRLNGNKYPTLAWILEKFHSKRHFGQAFKDPSWIQEPAIAGIIKSFEAITKLNFLLPNR